jgi:peptidylprolyl isomerase
MDGRRADLAAIFSGGHVTHPTRSKGDAYRARSAVIQHKETTMTQVKDGDTVKIHYTGKLDDGTLFDTSADDDPLEFTVGKHEVIPGMEDALIGMEPGDEKTITIPSENAYGPYHEEMVVVVNRSEFPEEMEIEVDQQLSVVLEDEQSIIVTVAEIAGDNVTLDANHPLAGEDLTFEIQLVEIVSPIIITG